MYKLYITTDPKAKPGDVGWTKISTTPGLGIHATVDGTTATLSNLEAGTTYYVFIRSVWSEKENVFSHSAIRTIQTPP